MTLTARFLLSDSSLINARVAAGFGVCYLTIGVLLLRPGSLGLWLGAIVSGIGGLLAGLVALGDPEPLTLFHAAIAWVVFPSCIYLLVPRTRTALMVAHPS